MRIIGLMGYARSGKDTVGGHLVREHGFERVGFADGVRESLLALDPIVSAYGARHSDERRDLKVVRTLRLSEAVDTWGWEYAKDNFPEVRALLQRMGTEAVRDTVDAHAWVNLAVRKVERAAALGSPGVVVTDVRFRNEVAALRTHGALLVWVSRPGRGPSNGHVSESSVSVEDSDVVLSNGADVEALYDQVDTLL